MLRVQSVSAIVAGQSPVGGGEENQGEQCRQGTVQIQAHHSFLHS